MGVLLNRSHMVDFFYRKLQYKDSLPGHLLALPLCFSEMVCIAPDLAD